MELFLVFFYRPIDTNTIFHSIYLLRGKNVEGLMKNNQEFTESVRLTNMHYIDFENNIIPLLLLPRSHPDHNVPSVQDPQNHLVSSICYHNLVNNSLFLKKLLQVFLR